jgi:hypothetical protein
VVVWLGAVACADRWTLTIVPHTIAGQDPFAGAPMVDVWAKLPDGTVGVAELGTADAERVLEGSGALPEGGFLGLYVREPDGGRDVLAGLRAWGRATTPKGLSGGDADVSIDVLVPLSHAVGQLGAFSPEERRFFGAAALLDQGDALLVGGLSDPTQPGTGRTEVLRLSDFDTGAPTATALAKLPDGLGLAEATATRLVIADTEHVWVAGGRADFGGPPLRAWALLDAATGEAVAQGDLVTARAGHAAVPLSTGEVLVLGGAQGDDVGLVEVFDPVGLMSRMVAQGADIGDVGVGVADLGDGTVLACGGADVCDDDEAALGLCAPVGRVTPRSRCVEVNATGTIRGVLPLPDAVAGAVLLPLGDGHVLAYGGVEAATDEGEATIATAHASIRNPTGGWRRIAPATHARIHHALVPVGNGNALAIGGSGVGSANGLADVDAVPCMEVYDLVTETFTEVLEGCGPVAGGAHPVVSQATADGLFVLAGIRAAGPSWDGGDGWGLVGLGP